MMLQEMKKHGKLALDISYKILDGVNFTLVHLPAFHLLPSKLKLQFETPTIADSD